jgi:DNA repair exonuclease SbcCD nuclease subunit
MAKFLYFQDGHCKGRNSVRRKGNYFEDWLLKFDELLSIAKKNKVNAILDGGDILDTSEPSYRVLDEIADRVEKAEIPIYCLFGNHAQRYHSVEHSRYTGLAHLMKRSEYFRYFDDPYLKHGQQRGFSIKGIDYYHNVEEDLKKDGIIFDKKFDDCWKIAVVHAFVTPKPFLKEVSHICAKDLKTNADLVLIAHYHAEWEVKVGETLIKDIGCFGRNSISEAKITPSCLLIDTDNRTIGEIELTVAKKGEDVFDLTKAEQNKEFDSNIEDFLKGLEGTDFRRISIEGMVQKIGKERETDQEVIDLIINKIY